MLYNFAKFIFYLYYRIFYRVRVTGAENVPKKGPVLLYANHPGTMDMFAIGVFTRRKVHYMAKIELFKNPILAFLLKRVGAFPVNRGRGDVGSVKTVFKLLEEGKVVGMFPEGTRTPKKDPAKRKAGAAMLAMHSGAPIVPVAIEWPSKEFSTLNIVFGKPFALEKKSKDEHPSKEELMQATNDIIDKIYSLIGQ